MAVKSLVLSGPQGSGKTSLAKHISCLHKGYSGWFPVSASLIERYSAKQLEELFVQPIITVDQVPDKETLYRIHNQLIDLGLDDEGCEFIYCTQDTTIRTNEDFIVFHLSRDCFK